jgi:surface polysaccharide O-acyltransferase-like enzyme
MTTARIKAIEYIRGIAMLGVVGIHTGAYSLTNPSVNIHLFAIFEIFTRFSVPIFFFISAFGLFYRQSLDSPFNYRHFFSRRLQTVLLPYVTWSLLYMLHYTWVSGDSQPWQPPLLYEYFIFGLASYQLYFLVILL